MSPGFNKEMQPYRGKIYTLCKLEANKSVPKMAYLDTPQPGREREKERVTVVIYTSRLATLNIKHRQILRLTEEKFMMWTPGIIIYFLSNVGK